LATGQLSVRVGITTGLVVVGPVGAGRHVEYGATGDAINTASRLQTAAAPGSVFVGDETYRGVSTLFDWRAPQELRLKGKREPVRAWPVSGMLAVRGGRSGPAALEAAMVGRTRELTIAEAAMRRVAAGSSATLLVVGAPGLGKTRLIEELQARWPAPGMRWFAGRCSSFDQRAYASVGSFLRNWLFLPADQPEDAVRAALQLRMEELLPPEVFLDVYPYLAAMLGLALAGPELARLADPSPEALHHRSAEALIHLFERVARDGPNVLVVEDAHWCDAASLEVLLRLVSKSDARNVGVVVTARPEGPGYERLLEGLQPTTDTFESFHLTPLSDVEQGVLLRELIGADVLRVELSDSSSTGPTALGGPAGGVPFGDGLPRRRESRPRSAGVGGRPPDPGPRAPRRRHGPEREHGHGRLGSALQVGLGRGPPGRAHLGRAYCRHHTPRRCGEPRRTRRHGARARRGGAPPPQLRHVALRLLSHARGRRGRSSHPLRDPGDLRRCGVHIGDRHRRHASFRYDGRAPTDRIGRSAAGN
jgi:hypothetical protein